MRHLFAGLKGFIWGTVLFAHVGFFVACISALYFTAPKVQDSQQAVSKLMSTLKQFASIREGNIPEVDLSEVADSEELERQYSTIKESGKPKANAFLWRIMAWSLLGSVTLGAGLLIFSWWGVKGRGVFRYFFTLGLVGPYSCGSLVSAAHLMKSLPASEHPFPPTLQGLYFFAEEPLAYLLQIPVVLFFVALPAWVSFARSRHLNFASIFFPRTR